MIFLSRAWILLVLLLMSTLALTQPSKEDSVLCYKSAIKEPIAFYGNPGDIITLYDGSRWKVASAGPFEYVPARYRNVLICPSEQVLIVDKRVLSVERV